MYSIKSRAIAAPCLIVKISSHYHFPFAYPLPSQYWQHASANNIKVVAHLATSADTHGPGGDRIVLGARPIVDGLYIYKRMSARKCRNTP